MPVALINGVRIYYEDKGIGKPIVFIHHLAGSLRSWKYVLPYFLDKYRVIAYDLRGHGRSEIVPGKYRIQDHRDDLKGLLDLLNIRRPILVGHSIGSLIAIDYAIENDVEVLILIGALVSAPSKDIYERYLSIAMNFGMRALAEYRRKNGDFTRYLTENQRVWSDFLSIYQENTPLGFKYTVEGLVEAPDYTDKLDIIRSPVLVIYGSEDRFITSLDAFKRKVRNLRYHVVNGYGHFLNLEAPDLISKLIIDFLTYLQV
ncbi:MAG: alpha/beta hydrolase [Sulfolobaceae archaeon]